MGEGEPKSLKKSTETKTSATSDFLKLTTIERLQQEGHDQAQYASEHSVPGAYDIIRSAGLSRLEISALPKKETAYDIIKSAGLSQSISEQLGLSPRDQWVATLRKINEALAPEKAPDTSVQRYDRYLHLLYPNGISAILLKVFALSKVLPLNEASVLRDVLACFREEEWKILCQQERTDSVEIVSDPHLQTDPFGYALCYGEEKVPKHNQQRIEKLLRDKYMPVPSVILPGDRMMMYSPSQEAYVAAGLIEECNWDTWEPTRISYLARDGGCIHEAHPRDFYLQTRDEIKARFPDDEIKLEFYRRKDILDELHVIGTNAKRVQDAKVIVCGDIHTDNVCAVLYARINQTFLQEGDTTIVEAPEREDKTIENGGVKIVQGTWDSKELQEKFKEVVRQQIRIIGEMRTTQIAEVEQLARLVQECYNGRLWASLPQLIKKMQEISSKHTEGMSALERELQVRREELDTFSSERVKRLNEAIERRTTQSPEKRLTVSVGLTHILIKQERDLLNLERYDYAVVISRHPRRDGKASREYTGKILGSGSEAKDVTG